MTKHLSFKISIVLSLLLIVITILYSVFLYHSQIKDTNFLIKKQKEYILNDIQKYETNEIKKAKKYLLNSINLIKPSLSEGLYNIDENGIKKQLFSFINSENIIKGVEIKDSIIQKPFITIYKKNNMQVSKTLPKSIKNLNYIVNDLIYNKEKIGKIKVYYDLAIIHKYIFKKRKERLSELNQFQQNLLETAQANLIRLIEVFIFIVIVINIILWILILKFVSYPLRKLQEGLNSFFRFLQNPNEKIMPIDYKSEDEIGEMIKEVNENIKVSEALHKEISSLMKTIDKNIAIINLDENGKIEDVSTAFCNLTGYSKDELINKNFSYFLDKEKSVSKEILEEVKKEKFYKREFRVKTKNQNTVYLSTIFTSKCNQYLECGYNGFSFDVTDKKRVEELLRTLEEKVISRTKELEEQKIKAEASEKTKAEFLANMSHEIRTPLNAMFGFITILQEKEFDDETKKYLNIIQKSGQNLLTIINDILDFSKIEAGKMSIEKIEFNPKEEIEVIHNLFASKASEKDILLEFKEKNLKWCLMSDHTRIKQVISNLLSNAIKFTPEHKKIILNIVYYENKEELFLEVIDKGIGIPKEKLEHIFESFSQADSSTTRKYGGTGLGLTISHKLIELLGGELKVESEVGKGSRFYFTIPAKKTKICQEKQEIKIKKILDEKFNKHVLVVEDNKANQMFMKVILQKMGITFDIANDGIEAIEKFKQNKYDLILMDENMPNMNGIEATKKIREIEKEQDLEHTIIVALTANALEGDKERFILAGMDYYLSKPLDIEKFKEILRKI